MNSKYRYLGKNTIIFAISSFGTKFLSFFLVPLYTATLTTAQYGSADLITTTSTLLGYILTINISSSVLRFTLENQKDKNKILSFGLYIICLGSLVCLFILYIIYNINFLNWPLYYYVFIFLHFTSMAFYELLTNYLRAIDKVKEVAVAGVLSSALIILGNIVFLLIIKIGLIGYLSSIVVGPIISSIYCFIIIIVNDKKERHFFDKCNYLLKKEMISYSVPLIFNNVALWINVFLDHYFVTYFCGVGENGIYAISGKISTILSTCFSVFSSAWTLSAIKEFDPYDKDSFFSNTYNIYGALMSILSTLIVLINIPLAKILYSNEFFSAWKYSSLLILAVMFNTLTAFQGSIFSAAKKTKAIATTSIISAIINTVLNLWLIPKIGALGAAIATAFSYFSMWLIRYILLKRIITMKINLLKDLIVYSLLTLQILFEHTHSHSYLGQIFCTILIMIFEWKYIKPIVSEIRRKLNYVHLN